VSRSAWEELLGVPQRVLLVQDKGQPRPYAPQCTPTLQPIGSKVLGIRLRSLDPPPYMETGPLWARSLGAECGALCTCDALPAICHPVDRPGRLPTLFPSLFPERYPARCRAWSRKLVPPPLDFQPTITQEVWSRSVISSYQKAAHAILNCGVREPRIGSRGKKYVTGPHCRCERMPRPESNLY